jgi:tetratricopeptide (TPR) repeat protein
MTNHPPTTTVSRKPSSISRPPQHRLLSSSSTATNKFLGAITKARHDHPFLFPALLITGFATVCLLAVAAYDQHTQEAPIPAGKFSPAVEHSLRGALWYSEIKPVPEVAVRLFTDAIEAAEREGMDLFGPEFTGIHIRFAAALEKFGQIRGAVETLNNLVTSLLERIEDIDLGRVGRSSPRSDQSVPLASQESIAESPELERRRLLKVAIQCKVKSSQLYESDHLQDTVSAKRTLDDALKLLIESMANPKGLQFDENRAGISADEAAALLSQAGISNLAWGNYDIALETFKLALMSVRKANKGKPSCREAFTLSNMHEAVSRMLDSPTPMVDGKPVDAAAKKQAHQILGRWASESLQCVQAVDANERDKFCSMAVISSSSGMASMLMEIGDLNAARGVWSQVIQMSEAQPALEDLVRVAQAGLEDINSRENNGRQ